MKAIAQALAKNTKLEELDLQSNQIGDEGEEALLEYVDNELGCFMHGLDF